MKKLIIAIMVIATILALASCESKDYSLKDYAAAPATAEEPVASTMVTAEEPVAVTIPDKIDLPYLPYTYLEEPAGTVEAQRYAASGMLPEEIAVDKATEWVRETKKLPYLYEIHEMNSVGKDGKILYYYVTVFWSEGENEFAKYYLVSVEYTGECTDVGGEKVVSGLKGVTYEEYR